MLSPVVPQDTFRRIDVRPLTGAMGAEIRAADPAVLWMKRPNGKCWPRSATIWSSISGIRRSAISSISTFAVARSRDHPAADFQAAGALAENQLLIWDSRATYHRAIADYDGCFRYLVRATVQGPRPV